MDLLLRLFLEELVVGNGPGHGRTQPSSASEPFAATGMHPRQLFSAVLSSSPDSDVKPEEVN